MKFIVPLVLALVACGPVAGGAASEATAPITGNVLITGNKGEDTISLIDLDTGTEHARLETGRMPHEIAISPDGTRAAVVAYGGTTIDVFDIASASRVERIDLSPNRRPHGLLWLPDDRLIATTEGSDSLTIVAMADRSVTQIDTGQEGSHMVAVSPDLVRAYVANMGSGTVSVIDLAAGSLTLVDASTHMVERTIVVSGTAASAQVTILFSADGRTIYVAETGRDQIVAVNVETGQILQRYDAGADSDGLAVTSIEEAN